MAGLRPLATGWEFASSRRRPEGGWTIVRMQGGLGNQLFQLAHGLTRAGGSGAALALETSFLPDEFGRRYRLHRLLTDLRRIRARIDRYDGRPLCSVRVERLAAAPVRFEARYHREGDEAPPNAGPRDIVLHGLWQDAAFAIGAHHMILERLAGPRAVGQLRDRRGDEVAVHVRLGDYVDNPNVRRVMLNLTRDYYTEAAELLRDDLGKVRFVVFSDDSSGASDIASAIGAELMPQRGASDELVDFHQMRSFTHHIIANSTFSWWAAFLKVREGRTVMPARWFVDPSRDSSLLHHEGWIKIR